MRLLPAGLVEKTGREALGFARADDRRSARTKADADATARAVDHEREPGDRDGHRVSCCREHIRLRHPGVVPFGRDDDLIGTTNGLLRAGHEIGEGHAALAPF